MGTPLENVSFNEDILKDVFKWVKENSTEEAPSDPSLAPPDSSSPRTPTS